MNKGKIVVIGSSNMDMVVKATHIPVPGETVLGGAFLMNPGGKGANQAVSVARLGGEVSFISKLGNDLFGKQSIQAFEEEGIDVSGVLEDRMASSGVALITVDDSGENSIVVASGANLNLSPQDVETHLKQIPNVDIILMQLEIPMDTVQFALEYAHSWNIRVILNPAPSNPLVSELFHMIDTITPNSHEAEMLTGIVINDEDSAKAAAQYLHQKGVKNVAITLGAKGAVLLNDDGFHLIPATQVDAIDTTAAGDVFNGALAVAIAEGKDLLSAVTFACKAASITTTRMGAQSSIPYRRELLLSSLPKT